LVFATLGLGLALPFLLVAFVPRLRNLLPKPGPWMRKLQRVLAIPMGLTVLACLWLLYRQTGWNGVRIAASGFFLFLMLLRIVGWMQKNAKVGTAIVGMLAIVVAVSSVALAPVRTAQTASLPAGAARWSEQAVAAELKRDHPVFVYFTADWCLTCKANEAAAIDRDEVQQSFKAGGVKTFVGDWTNGDPDITRFLESRGRAGVPLYLWYEPGREPEELPQILTPSMLISRARLSRR
jgi:thiol:disulfide interchange protein